jgi:hypothetical protein
MDAVVEGWQRTLTGSARVEPVSISLCGVVKLYVRYPPWCPPAMFDASRSCPRKEVALDPGPPPLLPHPVTRAWYTP